MQNCHIEEPWDGFTPTHLEDEPEDKSMPDATLAAKAAAAKDKVMEARVMEARAAYRATLDAAGRGSEDLGRAMEEAEAAWEAADQAACLEHELPSLKRIEAELDQLASEAAECSTLAPKLAEALAVAWWIAENGLRGVGASSCHNESHGPKWCQCCRHFNELRGAAERVGRLL